MTRPNTTPSAERYLIFAGNLEPYVFTETPLTRSRAIEMIASGEPDLKSFHSVIAYDVESHWSDDVTDSIVTAVVNKWADQGEPLSANQRDFVERFVGVQFANQFALEDA